MSAKITAALHEVMSKVSYVQKSGYNSFHKYKFAGEADLLAVLRPALVEAGLLLIPSVEEIRDIDNFGNTTVVMNYTLVHKDGDIWPHPIRIPGTGNDANSKGGVGDKGTYKAMTGANKYLLFKLFQIETGDEPENAHEAQPPVDRRSSKPTPKSVERGTPIADAHREITNGTASTVPQGKNKPGKPPTAKEWANSDEAKAWLAQAKTEINGIGEVKGVREWQDANAASMNALDDHNARRHAWIMDVINARIDYLSNILAAGD